MGSLHESTAILRRVFQGQLSVSKKCTTANYHNTVLLTSGFNHSTETKSWKYVEAASKSSSSDQGIVSRLAAVTYFTAAVTETLLPVHAILLTHSINIIVI